MLWDLKNNRRGRSNVKFSKGDRKFKMGELKEMR